jgi:hypothetical protein
VVRRFLQQEYERFSFGYQQTASRRSRTRWAHSWQTVLNRILTSPENDIRVRSLMDQGGVPLVNLAKGKVGEDSSSLLGGLLTTTIGLAAFSRGGYGKPA